MPSGIKPHSTSLSIVSRRSCSLALSSPPTKDGGSNTPSPSYTRGGGPESSGSSISTLGGGNLKRSLYANVPSNGSGSPPNGLAPGGGVLTRSGLSLTSSSNTCCIRRSRISGSMSKSIRRCLSASHNSRNSGVRVISISLARLFRLASKGSSCGGGGMSGSSIRGGGGPEGGPPVGGPPAPATLLLAAGPRLRCSKISRVVNSRSRLSPPRIRRSLSQRKAKLPPNSLLKGSKARSRLSLL